MMDYTTVWVPREGADLAALSKLHNTVFPGNDLSIVLGWVKVALADGVNVPKGATTKPPTPLITANMRAA